MWFATFWGGDSPSHEESLENVSIAYSGTLLGDMILSPSMCIKSRFETCFIGDGMSLKRKSGVRLPSWGPIFSLSARSVPSLDIWRFFMIWLRCLVILLATSSLSRILTGVDCPDWLWWLTLSDYKNGGGLLNITWCVDGCLTILFCCVSPCLILSM